MGAENIVCSNDKINESVGAQVICCKKGIFTLIDVSIIWENLLIRDVHYSERGAF